MALADYFARSALAAAQVLAGFDEQRIRELLSDTAVGIAVGRDAAKSAEGLMLLDLITRLVARLYPTLSICAESGAEHAASDAMDLARRVNPKIEFGSESTHEISIGKYRSARHPRTRIYVGSDSWNALLATGEPQPVGDSENPLGAGVAACLAAANIFRSVFRPEDPQLDKEILLSAFEGELGEGRNPRLPESLGESVLAGAGAIGNATVWALSRLPATGTLRLVDHEQIELGNLQRYVLAERADEAQVKVDVLRRQLVGGVQARPHNTKLAEFLQSHGWVWPRMLLALDSARDRRAAQGSLPQWAANAWTQPNDLGVASHDFLSGACVACLYLPDQPLPNEDEIVAQALGIPAKVRDVRTLLDSGAGTSIELLNAIAEARQIEMGRLEPFVGRPIRSLYVEGFCGGAVISLGQLGTPRQEVHVPLVHQSALAGVLLAGALVRNVLGADAAGTRVTRLNLMARIGTFITQPAAKASRGACICQDPDYIDVYKHKYCPA